MPRYLISFDDGSMDHIPEEDWPAVGEASHAVVRELKQVGAWIFGGGILRQQAGSVAAHASASSREATSMIEKPPTTALVSGTGPSVTDPSVATMPAC